MKFIYFSLCTLFICLTAAAQTIAVSGQCITGTITLAKFSDVNSRPAYQGSGTVLGTPGVTVYMYWMPAPDLVWVLDFDGQPYFQNSCNTLSGPPITGNASCPWTAVAGQGCTGAAPLSITGTGVVPVKLISFTATAANTKTLLSWKTASEINNKGFEVQRSPDGISWIRIGFVNGAGNSGADISYAFTDETPLPGKSYYRLVQSDLDGSQSVSPVATVDLAASAGYSLKTINTNNGVYQLTILSSESMEISVMDLGGRRLIHLTAGQGVHQLDLSKYAPGMYLLELRKNNKSTIEKLIKR